MQCTVKISRNISSYCDHPNKHETVLQLFEEILKFDNLEVLFGFSWGKEIKPEEWFMSSLTLTKHDLNITIPVSKENIKRLQDISLKKQSCNKGYNTPFNQSSIGKALEISASEFCGSSQQEVKISSLVAYHLQLPTKLMGVKAQLQRLIMFEPGDKCFLHNCGSSITKNKIGTVIFQLPAEGGHEGGRLNVKYDRKKAAFENHGNSDKNFYLTAFYNCCEEFMEPISKGHKLILVFDLIWKDAKTEIPRNFPVFLTALQAIKQVLKHWICQNVVNLEFDSHHFKNTNQEDSSEVNTSDHLISEWALKEKIIFFILQEAYEDKFIAFELLRGRDRILAELLLNCSFLDVHLAIPALTIKSEESLDIESEKPKKGEDLLKISSLIDSNDITRKLCFELDWNKHFVGLIQSNQEKVFNENRKDKVERGKRNLHHGILLMWPKHHSVSMYCRFGLHSFLIRMGHMLNSSPKWKDETQQSIRSDLRQLLLFCRAEPQLAWGSTSSLEKGELTTKLLRFCIILRVREEGFYVLKLIGSDFDSENFEGIQNDEVAQAIADFVSQVAVWEDVVQLIKPLIFRDRIVKQLHPIMKLAKFLLKTNCVQGANMIGDSVSSFFAELHPTCAAKMKESDIKVYMDMVVSLETNPDTSSQTRIASFIRFFYKLRPSRLQCQLVWDLQTQYSWCLKSMQPFQILLCELFESLTDLSEVSGTENSSCIPLTIQTSLECQNSISTLRDACFEYENPQVSVPYYSPWNNAKTSNDLETPSCISGRGFLLERLRELWEPANEGETPTTGGSICSISDYLFQLRDFDSAFKKMSRISAVQANMQQTVFDSTLGGELYIKNSIQKDSSKDSNADEEKNSKLEKFNVETSEAINLNENNHTSSSCTTQFAVTHEPPAIFLNDSSIAGTGVQHTVASVSYTSPGSLSRRSVNLQELVPNHSPWNTAPKSNHSESSFIPRKGLLLERLRDLFNPAVEGEISTTGGSICSLSDYLFQLCDFESAFEDVSSTYVVNPSDQRPVYEVPVHPLPIKWVRKLPYIEVSHCRGTTSCADDLKNSEVVVENNVETSSTWCTSIPVTVPKLKSSDSNHSFGLLVPTLPTSSPAGTNVPSSSIDSFSYRSSESSLRTITSESNLVTKAESSGVSMDFKDSSAVDVHKTFVDEENSGRPTYFWNGVINSKEIGKINVGAIEMIASKLIPKLNMPPTLELVGRIKPENIWNYINQTIRSGTRDIIVISFIPVSDSSRKVYSSFIRHMQQKERFAVVGPFSKLIKDFYLVPLLKDSPFPSALNSFSQVFENRTSSMLLGILIPSRTPKAIEASSSSMP